MSPTAQWPAKVAAGAPRGQVLGEEDFLTLPRDAKNRPVGELRLTAMNNAIGSRKLLADRQLT